MNGLAILHFRTGPLRDFAVAQHALKQNKFIILRGTTNGEHGDHFRTMETTNSVNDFLNWVDAHKISRVQILTETSARFHFQDSNHCIEIFGYDQHLWNTLIYPTCKTQSSHCVTS